MVDIVSSANFARTWLLRLKWKICLLKGYFDDFGFGIFGGSTCKSSAFKDFVTRATWPLCTMNNEIFVTILYTGLVVKIFDAHQHPKITAQQHPEVTANQQHNVVCTKNTKIA